MAQKSTPDAAPKDDSAGALAVVHAIHHECSRLEGLRRTAVARIIELEKMKVIPERPSPEPDVRERARKMLNGHGQDLAPSASGGVELYQLQHDLEAIELALTVLQSKALRARAEVLAALKAEKMPEWVESTRQVALVTAHLERVVAEREGLRDLFRRNGGVPSGLPVAELNMTGDLRERDQRKRFVEAAICAGLVTKKELDNA